MNKAESAKIGILAGTPGTQIDTYATPFAAETLANPTKRSLPPLNEFSLVLDCTDNLQTRYLISDACAAAGLTLVSGAAIRTEGQLSVWNLPLEGGGRGPCYRCIFPEPVEDRLEQRCEDEGVLGPVVGLVGILMALEAVRLLTGTHNCVPTMLLIPSFRTIKLRKAQTHCNGCGLEAKTRFFERLHQQPTSKPCGRPALPPDIVPLFKRISPIELRTGARKLEEFGIVDVRPPAKFSICSLPRSTNLPIGEVLGAEHHLLPKRPILFVCRRGNDSQLAAQAVGGEEVYDLEGGLVAYAKQVDHSFPLY
ncbi:hypothetical protein CROQUDRAFT_659977 [Cronartium quercuum f. sp. fusiforme G11]|uniref:Rhodanese domain-containing protein n=1 Tax=Cronartium quercuum f. sp. fusiforme G11 TaxID=708437 RepID=A0A9P6NI17_9BASI|nr:hypothetical protein CROQUDRAFT_659977 [Cronartium quercuum f. sp. fusiforme G11]